MPYYVALLSLLLSPKHVHPRRHSFSLALLCGPSWPSLSAIFIFWVFGGRPRIVDLWDPGGPGGLGDPSKRWGTSRPTLFEWFPRPTGPPGPPKSAISGRPKIKKYRKMVLSDGKHFSTSAAAGQSPSSCELLGKWPTAKL